MSDTETIDSLVNELATKAYELNEAKTVLFLIEILCRRHNNPGVNIGAHKLADEVLKIIGVEP